MHTVRDHPNHRRLLNGGMWGATRRAQIHGKVEMLARQYFDHDAYGADLDFSAADIAPLVEQGPGARQLPVRVVCRVRGPSLLNKKARGRTIQHGVAVPRRAALIRRGRARADGAGRRH